ncbi:hypothetical protein [Paraburkholderia sp. J11-2]|uniref:hypothetical protein n=1 Tax=Paraburkholderia sp. J11-2 TaxID=2805431 RepID=UPI002AB7EC84|nr:hypothetical protein [Paraburkholderia sp. J11-2]
MLETPLTAQARLALNRYSSDNPIRTLLPLWRQFEDFLQSHSRMPASILEIPEDTLRAYASYLDYRDCHVDDALVALSAVLLVCLNAGYSGKVLRTIVIPRIRRPVENRQWDAFRLRTYQPLESSQLARSRRRRAKREVCAQDAARPDNAPM